MSENSVETTGESKSYEEILADEIHEGLREFNRASESLFLSAVSAGLDIGFSALAVVTVITLVGGVYGEPLTQILVANAYTIGFIFVVLGRSELFTEHTSLAVLPVIDRQRPLAELGRVWGLIYAGNIVGGIVFGVFIVTVGPAFGIFELSALTGVAQSYLKYSAAALFGAAILAGWLMGLLSWLVTAAEETIGRILVVWLVTGLIGFAHLPHSIVGHVELFGALVAAPEITLADYGRFMVLATVGNAIGGTVFVALLKYGHVISTVGDEDRRQVYTDEDTAETD
jgi:formate/nitrite transporter FocA (FNT family)